MALYWRDVVNTIEADLLDNGEDEASLQRAKLITLDMFRRDYEKQIERAENEAKKIEFECLKIRRKMGES